MRRHRVFEIGGIAASIVLVIFGIIAIVVGFDGRSTVRDSIHQEQITGTPDMTPSLTEKAVKEAGLANKVEVPDCSVANEPIDNGDRARCFASYMRVHALEATGGLTYAQMPRFATADGKGTDDVAQAEKGANGQPVSNPAREVWITETALSTALNTSYLAERVSIFGIVMGFALLLCGIGFAVLTIGGALKGRNV